MIFQEGYVYHIKDEYFEKVQDKNLMQNKEGGTYRPTFYCLRDSDTSLLWMVPLSSRIEKFKAIHDKQVAKYGKSLTIVLGEFDGKEAAFLLQNIFPIRDYYLDHIHTRNNNPVPVKHSIQKEVTTRIKKIRNFILKEKKLYFLILIGLNRLCWKKYKITQPINFTKKRQSNYIFRLRFFIFSSSQIIHLIQSQLLV